MDENYKNIRRAVRAEIRENSSLIESLKRFADNDAVFYPGYGNLGDGLIALGTLDLFADLGWDPKRIQGRHKEAFSGYTHIVMGGSGGWVKGMWETYLEQTIAFLQNGGQLLILPTSFSGFGSEFVPYADQVTIFCREQRSYDELLRQGMPESQIFVCPDMAFYTKEEHFSDLEIDGQYPVLQIFRLDEEGGRKTPPRDSVDLPLLFNDIQWSTVEQCVKPLRAVAGLMSQFECVETDRLHMAALAALIGRTVKLEPSSYFKIKAIFDYTLHRFPTVTFEDRTSDYTLAEQGGRAEVQLLRDTVKRINLDRQAEWEQRTTVLRQNDALLSRLEKLQSKLTEISEEKKKSVKKQTDFTNHINHLEREISRKDREFYQVRQELEKIQSSRLHRVGEKYYSIFGLPVFGVVLRMVRKVIVR
ncbi:polysaccharide pyruvyl transferase family protein [Acetobacter sp. P5B1]|uniref:polysaccharide pyruvyl transferase family protein n=1 Tax=Acetobacter sp. P5B1 TaxID=2762620 RepID=UPI001C04D6CF|nr:polysaccharide pyruvyl transferase family protein [Acetobacter sp. P5B1]